MSVLDELATSAGHVSVCAFLIAAGSAHASTVSMPNVPMPRGAPIAQNFLDSHGDNISLLATGNGASCVASKTLPIASSVYVDANGTPVDFKDVIRSPATSIQAIARPGAAIEFRIQLKYSPDPAKPISLDVAGQTFDLAMSLEPSSDSLWLTGTDAQMLAEALLRGDIPNLSATSSVSGRLVIDQITAPDMAGMDACRITLDELLSAQKLSEAGLAGLTAPLGTTPLAGSHQDDTAPTLAGMAGRDPANAVVLVSVDEAPAELTLPEPVAGLRLEFVARPDPDKRIAPSALEKCRMSNIPENVYLGRLTSVTGFFSQTQDVYVAFDEQGQVQRAYIPGIFDSELRPEGGSARVSLAADTNLPDRTNMVKGCLGDALMEAPVCVSSEEGSDRYTIAECGVLGTSESREDMLSSLGGLALPGLTGSNPLLESTKSGTTGAASFGRVGFGWSGGGSSGGIVPGSFLDDGDTQPGGNGGGAGGGGGLPGGQGGGWDGDGGDVSPVPLPAGIWLMLGALTGMSGLGVMARRRQGLLPVAGPAHGATPREKERAI
ncbi:MAG: VPLPA-CTERM sorting domain-containing protein [Paracoccaceae bacterium]